MKREFNAKNLIFSVALGVASALALYIFFKIFASYSYPTYFYHPVKEEEKALAKYIGKAGFFAYFTYLSLGIAGLWGVGRTVCFCLGLEKGLKLFDNEYVVIFVTLNEIVTLVAYCVPQYFSAVPFGFTGWAWQNLKGFLQSTYMHILFPACVIAFFVLFKSKKEVKTKKVCLCALFPLLYVIIVKFLGKFVYPVEWYPYPVFSAEGVWLAVFKNLDNFNRALGVIGVIICAVLLIFLYSLSLMLLAKITNKKFARQNNLAHGEKA
ncbi:MAG TPA: hypothetical protein DDY77_00820 [Clostridiales bacterium]|nr:hypothetical protein [Clostridiales bacterium]